MTTLTLIADDRSTYVARAAFADEDGDPVVPDSITWTLTTATGAVVNEREAVEVETPAATVDIVLSGDDLDYDDGPSRVLTIEATYTSTLGAGLPITGACRFGLRDLVAVEAPAP